MIAREAFDELIARHGHEFNYVLDVGCGQGYHADAFTKRGKMVTGVDIAPRRAGSLYEAHMWTSFEHFSSDIAYDLVWASHVLEHQLNAGQFLQKLISHCKPNGLICVTVPPLKHNIVGGHVSLWNGGLLLYSLVMAGLDLSDAKLKKYGYNISVICRNIQRPLPEDLHYDSGDIEILADRFPAGLNAKQSFNGDIDGVNWS